MRFKTALNNKGFTLLELIIVMAIIGLLAAGVLLTPGILDNRNKAVDTNNLDAAAKIQQQIYAYYITTGNRYLPEAVGSAKDLDVDGQLGLKALKIISSDTNITANTFKIIYSAEGTPNVGFVLTSSQNKANSKCFTIDLAVAASCNAANTYFFVPASGKLGSKNTQ